MLKAHTIRFAHLSTRAALAVLLGGFIAQARSAETPTPAETAKSVSIWDLDELLDHLPDLSELEVPGFRPTGAVKFYVRPHFGDLLHRDYLRVPVGARAKVTNHIELRSELEGYFTHGLGSGSAGYGLSRARVGAQHEQVLRSPSDTGLAVGFDFDTPVSRPPVELNDGHRHTLPYVSVTRPLVPEWKLVGYANLGADFIAHTMLPANFGRNALHGNSLSFSAGVAREWPRFRASFTASVASTSLTSDENHHVFALRPDVIFPLTRRPNARTRLMLTLGPRAVWGPDGTDFGVSSSLRIELLLHHLPAAK